MSSGGGGGSPDKFTKINMTSIIEQEAVEIQNKCKLELEKLLKRKHTESDVVTVEILN